THPRAGLSHAEWRTLGPAQKVEHLLKMSLDRAAEILSWGPVADLDAHRLHVWLQVWRVVFMIGTKALFDGKLSRDAARERDRDRILGELMRGFEERAAASTFQALGKAGVPSPGKFNTSDHF